MNGRASAAVRCGSTFSSLCLCASVVHLFLEFLRPRPEVELEGPGALGLAMHLPIAVGDGVGGQPVLLGRLADAAVDDDMADMEALGTQLARHALGQRAKAE